MTIQFDVKSAALANAYADTVFDGPTRIKGILVNALSNGVITLKDGGSSGTTQFSYTAPGAAESVYILVPGDGIRCQANLYATTANATATVFYG